MLSVHQETIHVDEGVLKSIRAHAMREKGKGGYECVGFLAGRHGGPCTATLPLNNHASNPTEAFFVEPWEQFRAEQKLKKEGYTITGVYHSHVNGEALPSRMDHAMARAGEIVIIYSVYFDDVKAYRETEGVLIPVEMNTKEPQ